MSQKIEGTLIGVDSHAFSIIGHFSKEAKKCGWSQGDINLVIDKALDDDYYHLIRTISEQFTMVGVEE